MAAKLPFNEENHERQPKRKTKTMNRWFTEKKMQIPDKSSVSLVIREMQIKHDHLPHSIFKIQSSYNRNQELHKCPNYGTLYCGEETSKAYGPYGKIFALFF
jgi:hypothetical protein